MFKKCCVKIVIYLDKNNDIVVKLNNDNIKETIENAKSLLAKEKNISPALRSVIQLLFVFMQAMLERFNLNSKNSSKPPSSDPNREKPNKPKKSKNKPGGQPGRKGTQLKPVDNPDKIEQLKLDKRKLPKGDYTDGGYESRQVIDFDISITVTEYRAQVLIDANGKRYVANFPEFAKRPVQYGTKTKATAVYMSQYQLIPYNRVEDYFAHEVGLNVSTGSLFNFNQEAYQLLDKFENISIEKLVKSEVINADETGVNVNGKRLWLHTACNEKWTYFYPHAKRGCEAMSEMGILPVYQGIVCHDHWKSYYTFENYANALCNAHHLRELEWSNTQDKQQWAADMASLLCKLNDKVKESENNKLTQGQRQYYRKKYDEILDKADIECPPPIRDKLKPKRGRLKKTKSRNLLERLREYKEDVLRFTKHSEVPFTNNRGENDIRMTKVQQKISGCFRSMEGAYIFCRIRAYLVTCNKHGVGASEALETLFNGKLPDFVYQDAE